MQLFLRILLVGAGLFSLVLLYILMDLFKVWPLLHTLKRRIGGLVTGAAGAVRATGSRIGEAFARAEPAPVAMVAAPISNVGSSAAPGSPTFQLRGRIAELEAANRSVGRRNRTLFLALLAGILALLVVLWTVYRNEVLSYAVLDQVVITRDPVNEGRFRISFQVTSPGRVVYRRTSGEIETEVVDEFHALGKYERSWAWLYEPGKDINVSLRYRGGLWRAGQSQVFPTSDNADIVVLMDTTGSMSPSIAQLKEKCVSFSAALTKQNLRHRFALIGFGDTEEGAWLDKHPFTDDAEHFRRDVESIRRFDGGDLPESALDALEQALNLPFNPGSIRRFYLVTDAAFHEPTKSGARADDIAKQLEKNKILLSIFSKEEFRKEYVALVDDPSRFQEIEGFGQVLSEGRVLED